MNKASVLRYLFLLLTSCGQVARVENHLGDTLPDKVALPPSFLPPRLDGKPLDRKTIRLPGICEQEAVGQSWLNYTSNDIFNFRQAKLYYQVERIKLEMMVLLTLTATAAEQRPAQISRFDLVFALSQTKEAVDCAGLPPVLTMTAIFRNHDGESETWLEYEAEPNIAAAEELIKDNFNQASDIFYVCLNWRAAKSSKACVNFESKMQLFLWGKRKDVP